MKRTICALIGPILMASALLLVGGTAAATNLAEVRTAFNGLRDGNVSPDAAVAVVEAYRRDNPVSPLAIAYMGSVRAIQGSKATMPWRKMSYIGEGFNLLDQAAAMLASSSPEMRDAVAVEVLLVCGMTNISVPKVFKRRVAAQANLETLLAQPGFEQLDEQTQALVYAWLAVLTSEKQPPKSASYLANARRLDQPLSEEIWSKRK
jgi:hypothetical protein